MEAMQGSFLINTGAPPGNQLTAANGYRDIFSPDGFNPFIHVLGIVGRRVNSTSLNASVTLSDYVTESLPLKMS